MNAIGRSGSARARQKISHPVIDCDGHWTEPIPVWAEYIQKISGTAASDAFLGLQSGRGNAWYEMSSSERKDRRYWRPAWWGFPANTIDRATAMLPELMYRRLDEFGIDVAIILPTRNNTPDYIQDPALRRAVVRAANTMQAEMFAPYADRIIPAAVLPTNTPEEAIEEAEYVVRELGMKTVVINGSLLRPIPRYFRAGEDPAASPHYIDTLALDSPYDYDPLWAALVDLKLAPMTHSGSRGWLDRSSVSNDVYNHAGHFAQAANAFARAVYLGGVTRRFPSLKFAFLECGVAWARALCADLVAHWEKRNETALLTNLQPSNLDLAELRRLIKEHGGPKLSGRADELMENIDVLFPGFTAEELTRRELQGGGELDDFAAVGVDSKEAVAAEFARSFYFGCESDDPLISLAFDNRLGPALKPLFSSDISHFDVTDMTEVLAESYELVERGLLDESEFRSLTFSNTVELHAGTNPGFFDGTIIAESVAAELATAHHTSESTPARPGQCTEPHGTEHPRCRN
jgi:predicted TIM-barrel fold metal-dependent hydrolase